MDNVQHRRNPNRATGDASGTETGRSSFLCRAWSRDGAAWPGVVVRGYDGETPSLIPGFKTVSMRDVIMQPGSKTMGPPMENAMVCHITEGELRVEQDGKAFTAKKDFVWTCNKDTKEQSFNDGRVVAIMRITDLKA